MMVSFASSTLLVIEINFKKRVHKMKKTVGVILLISPMLTFAASYSGGIQYCEQVKKMNVYGVKWQIRGTKKKISDVQTAQRYINASPFCSLVGRGNHYDLIHYDSNGSRHRKSNLGLHADWKGKNYFNNTNMDAIWKRCIIPHDLYDENEIIERTYKSNPSKICRIKRLSAGKLHSY